MRINRTASFFVALSLLASTVVALSATANAAGNPNCNAVDGDYIVSFAPGVNVDNEIKSAPGRAISAKFRYTSVLNGFAATLSAEQVCAFEKRPKVQNVEPDGFVSIDAITLNQATGISTQTPLNSWGLDRIDQSNNGATNSYSYTSTGDSVIAYVIDTGILTTHTDFSSRAIWGTNTTGDRKNQDCNGHGTHVAGTIGGYEYGIAKKVTLIAVKVLNCRGSGTNSGVISGLDWIKLDFEKRNISAVTKAVANMSLGGGASTALDNAVASIVDSKIVMVVAAGNSKADACNYSPARSAKAITVAATDSTDNLAVSFSNYGSCVDVSAPGVGIKSDYYTSSTATTTMSGTSMASPHVAGVIARFLEKNSYPFETTGVGEMPESWSSNSVKLPTDLKFASTSKALVYADPKM